MKFDILTIFPNIVEPYFQDSIMKKARDAGLFDFFTHDLREYTTDKHRTVDDDPYGGGPGMVMMVEPIYKAVNDIKKEGGKVVLLSAKGAPFTQAKAEEYAKLDQLILIAGRYEGVDERVADYVADEEISVGPYILSGGELPAMVVVEATARLIPDVLGNEESIESREGDTALLGASASNGYPVYTRPEVFVGDGGEEWRVPDVLLSGNHAEIEKWRNEYRQ